MVDWSLVFTCCKKVACCCLGMICWIIGVPLLFIVTTILLPADVTICCSVWPPGNNFVWLPASDLRLGTAGRTVGGFVRNFAFFCPTIIWFWAAADVCVETELAWFGRIDWLALCGNRVGARFGVCCFGVRFSPAIRCLFGVDCRLFCWAYMRNEFKFINSMQQFLWFHWLIQQKIELCIKEIHSISIYLR